MAPESKIRKLAANHGFVEHEARGVIGFHREHSDGRRQGLGVFWWSNDKHAAEAGIPRYYLVLDVSPGVPDAGGRFRLPMVAWPAAPADQTIRPWADVVAEFEEVFLPLLDSPVAQAPELTRALGNRYSLWAEGDLSNDQAWTPRTPTESDGRS
ncbi:Uncharacterised protein [Mycobacteroides abscessus]|uniref:Uncharacterized protein n=1 Tax=Mycobacteroides abscessus TaxID=36809 RepID=A0A0U0ZTX4_9MYCO|nr:Uncharacterised protein [Mycobacteroides abscessus]